jgi:hypothetical protein
MEPEEPRVETQGIVRSMQEYLERYFGGRPSKPTVDPELPPDQYGALIAHRSLRRVLRDAGKLK